MPSDLAPNTTVVAIADQASVDLDDEAAILNLKTGVYFGLNEVGAWIWRLIQAAAHGGRGARRPAGRV